MSPANLFKRKGQTSMVSLAVYSLVIVVGISTVMLVGRPILEDMRDATAIDNAKDMLSGVEDQIRAVAEGGEGSQTEVGLRFSRGDFVFNAEEDQISYELQTMAQLISPHSSKQIGNLRMSSLANVEVSEATVNGQDCWRVENEHVSVCIRRIPQNSSRQITPSTVGFWRLNENSGTTAKDSSQYRNTGSLGNASGYTVPSWTDGLYDSSLMFGGEEFVSIPESTAIDNAFSEDNLTISVWVKPAKTGGYQEGFAEMVAKSTSNSGAGIRLENADTASPDTVFYLSNGSTLYKAKATDQMPSISDWTHIVGMYDGDTMYLYFDGQLQAQNTVSTTIQGNNEPLVLGAATSHSTDFFEGKIDEVRIYNRSLTDEEISWQARSRGDLNFIDTRDLLLRYYNKDAGKLLNADFSIDINTGETVGYTNNGTGYVKPDLTGNHLGQGQVNAHVKSFFGIDYTVEFTLFSNSDFLKVDVEE